MSIDYCVVDMGMLLDRRLSRLALYPNTTRPTRPIARPGTATTGGLVRLRRVTSDMADDRLQTVAGR